MKMKGGHKRQSKSTQTPNNTIKYQKYIAKHRETHGQAAAVKTHTHSHLTRDMGKEQGNQGER